MSYRMNSMEYQITEPERTAAEMQRLRAENERLAKEVTHWREARRTALLAGDVLKAENERLSERLALALEITAEQAEDEGLWCPAATATEAYLQQELRRLHVAVEGER